MSVCGHKEAILYRKKSLVREAQKCATDLPKFDLLSSLNEKSSLNDVETSRQRIVLLVLL